MTKPDERDPARPGHLRLVSAPVRSSIADPQAALKAPGGHAELFGTEFMPFPLEREPTRPAKVIELDGLPQGRWRFEHGARYIWNGRLWQQEPVGCVLCVEAPDGLTLGTVDDKPLVIVCLEHGVLREVPYEVQKTYTIRIGEVVREGEESTADTMLFPTEMTLLEQTALIERLLDEAQEEEVAGAPAPSD